MALPDVQVVSIPLARVTFVTRRAGPQGGAQCDRPPRAGWVTSACVRSQMRPVACDCVIRTQPALETIHARWVNTCRVPIAALRSASLE
jgi:hypothetical protein